MAPVQERWVERDTWLLFASGTRCVLWEVMGSGDAMRGLPLRVQGTGQSLLEGSLTGMCFVPGIVPALSF